MKNVVRSGILLVVASVLCVAVAAQDQAKRAEEVAKGMVKFQEHITKVTNQVDRVVASLGVVASPGGDPVKTFQSFEQAVKDTKKLGEEAREHAKKSGQQRAKFIDEWTKAQKRIQNEDLRKAAEQRQAALTPLVEGVNAALEATSKSAEPFMQNLNDLVLFLGNDLSAQAISAAAPAIEKCMAAAAQLKKDLAASSTAVAALGAFFKPGGK